MRRGGFFNGTSHALKGEGFDGSEDGSGRGTPIIPIAFSCKDIAADAGPISPTLRSMNHTASHANGGGQVAVAFNWNAQVDQMNFDPHTTPSLTRSQEPAIGPLGLHLSVRRLTPRECERLQGFPDGYTDIQYKGKAAPDGPRYKALGNSMAVPVMRWIGQRIQSVAWPDFF
jgi:DNA (cytosine-5)-methyltransferase 1